MHERRRRGSRLAAGSVALTVLVGGLSACIGATERDAFERQVRLRSGGVSGELLDRAVVAVGDRIGTPAPSLRAIVLDGEQRTVSLEVQDPRDPEKIDRYGFHDDSLGDPLAVLVSSTESLELTTFRMADVPALADVRELVDRTLDELAIDDALVTRLTVRRTPTEGIRITLDAASDRRAGSATFDADGALLAAGLS